MSSVCNFIRAIIFILATSCALSAGQIAVPNNSFESPVINFVSFGAVDIWEKTPKPADYNEGGGFLWDQLTGIFKNTPPAASDHIHNCDGDQALWFFAVPEVGLFQDSDTTNGLNAVFEPGKSYTLTMGVIGGGGGMREGASLEAGLYYRDDASNRVIVAITNIVHTLALFPDKTNFVDQSVHLPMVRAGDAWAGKNIGIQFLSTVNTNNEGGYWDLDNVRLTSVQEPALRATITTNGQFELVIESEPGLTMEIQSSTNLLPGSWAIVQTLTNHTGATNITFDSTDNQVFYRIHR